MALLHSRRHLHNMKFDNELPLPLPPGEPMWAAAAEVGAEGGGGPPRGPAVHRRHLSSHLLDCDLVLTRVLSGPLVVHYDADDVDDAAMSTDEPPMLPLGGIAIEELLPPSSAAGGGAYADGDDDEGAPMEEE